MLCMDAAILLTFDAGTIVVAGASPDRLLQLPGVRFDPRTNVHRAEARHYRAIVEHLRASKPPIRTRPATTSRRRGRCGSERDPFPHQTEAVETWWKRGGRGVVVLPTGTGKTFIAILAIQDGPAGPGCHADHRPAQPVVRRIVAVAFDVPIGLIGGGHHDMQPITVTTYDSAYIHRRKLGQSLRLARLRRVPSSAGADVPCAAIGSIAPFRLGLTATPERADGLDALLSPT